MTIVRMRLKGNQIYIHTSMGNAFAIPKNGISELDIYEGMDIEEDDIISIRIKAYENSARKASTNMLTRGFLSEGILKDKLKKKGHKNRFIKHAVKYCKEYDLINDKRFAKIAVTSLKLKGKSKRYIIGYLKKSKIKPALIEKASRLITDKNEKTALKNAIKKYYLIYKDKEKCEELLIRALMRKGFNYDSVSSLVKIYVKKSARRKRI